MQPGQPIAAAPIFGPDFSLAAPAVAAQVFYLIYYSMMGSRL